MKENTGLELEEDLSHTRLYWKIKRIGWTLMFFIILLGLSGITGDGFLSSKRVKDAAGNFIEYEKYLRYKRESHLNIEYPGRNDSIVSISLSCLFLEKVRIKEISPLPLYQKQENGNIIFFFKISPGMPSAVKFFIRPVKSGYTSLHVSINKKDDFNLEQFIYP